MPVNGQISHIDFQLTILIIFDIIFSYMKKTKIIATIGPATENRKIMERLMIEGMDVARLNFSHGDHEEHEKRVLSTRYISQKLKKPIAILQDLSGPKIRIGDFYKESIILKDGQKFTFTTKKCTGDEANVFINYKNLPLKIKKDATILLNDGKNEFKVEKVHKDKIYTKIIIGGEIKGRRGVNLPDTPLNISSLTKKDKKDIKFGIKNKVDFMAISFVRNAANVLELKNILKGAKANIKIISKIETKEAIENIDEIIDVSDGILVARGDLAVEVGAEKVPMLQKAIIKKCNDKGKPVITATQMLESMIKNPIPTRAEINDVANAILDGTDAVMLSEETTLGNYPIKSVEVMARVARHTEENFNYEEVLKHNHLRHKLIVDSISYSVVNVAHNINAKAIFALTEFGFTARMISRCKPKQPIIALTPNEKTYNRLALSFGCKPLMITGFKNILKVTESAKKIAFQQKIAEKGDKIIICAGIPFGKPGTTNMLMVETI